METRIKRGAFALLFFIALTGCKGMGLGSLDTEEGKTFPGLESLSTESEENKKEREWLDKFYGRKSGTDNRDCAFYGTCPTESKGWW